MYVHTTQCYAYVSIALQARQRVGQWMEYAIINQHTHTHITQGRRAQCHFIRRSQEKDLPNSSQLTPSTLFIHQHQVTPWVLSLLDGRKFEESNSIIEINQIRGLKNYLSNKFGNKNWQQLQATQLSKLRKKFEKIRNRNSSETETDLGTCQWCHHSCEWHWVWEASWECLRERYHCNIPTRHFLFLIEHMDSLSSPLFGVHLECL